MLIFWCAGSALAQAAPWQLAWADEFNYEGLPDQTKWGYEEGYLRNNEAQYYTRGRPENAHVTGGLLVITGRKERFPIPPAGAGANGRTYADYTSASLVTLNKMKWQYGRLEVKAKLPQGKGVWPAIWTLGTNIGQSGWPGCGEIDIMEFVGQEPGFIHGTVHYGSNGKHLSSGQQVAAREPFADFHLYAAEWSPDRIDFYYDEQKYHTFPVAQAGAGSDNPFRRPQYLIINLALGGAWGGPIDDTIFPQQLLVDYVRVYKQRDTP